MTIKNVIVVRGERRWLIREAVNMDAAENAIAHARVSGSVGHTDAKSRWDGTKIVDEVTLASVVQINSDGTERQPYTEAY